MNSKKIMAASVAACFAMGAVAWAATTATIPSYQVVAGTSYSVTIEDTQISPYPAKNLFGTHSLWWGTQDMVQSNGTNWPVFNTFLKNTGGTLRFGGAVDEVSYKACATGPRTAVKAVSWSGPMVCNFGLPEYVATLKATGGDTTWTIANLAGIDYKLFTTDELTAEAKGAAGYVKGLAPTMTRYWELGNELERGAYKWTSDFLAARASIAGKAIRSVDPDAKLVLPLIEFDASWQPARRIFNEKLMRAMTVPVNGISLHLYYDGPPSGPSIPTQISNIPDNARIFNTVFGTTAAVWVTEHARWPQGESLPNWSDYWYRTSDMEGLMGTTDFVIAASQVPELAGLMLHGMRAGPWNVFDKVAKDKEPTLGGIGMLYTNLSAAKPAIRLKTSTISANISQYRGGYDLRAGAFKTADAKTMSVWYVNRNPSSISVANTLPASMANAALISSTIIDCPLAEGKCAAKDFRLASLSAADIKRSSASAQIKLPGRSVSILVFKLP